MWKGMWVQGESFSPAEQEAAWEKWIPSTGYTGLAAELIRARGLENCPQAYRGADRMLQIARKAGAAKYLGKAKWTKT